MSGLPTAALACVAAPASSRVFAERRRSISSLMSWNSELSFASRNVLTACSMRNARSTNISCCTTLLYLHE